MGASGAAGMLTAAKNEPMIIESAEF